MRESMTDTTPQNPASRMIAKFGNARDVSRALSLLDDPQEFRTPASIYKWTWPRPAGTGGQIPRAAIPGLKRAGRLVGVLLTPADLYGEDV